MLQSGNQSGIQKTWNHTKKKTLRYKEQDKEKVKEYHEKIKDIPKEKIAFIDETGIDKCLYREYGYALRGQKVYDKISGKKFQRTSIVAAKLGKKIIAPMQYSGTMNSALFELWFEKCLLPCLEKGATIVMDNASFHRKKQLYEICRKYGSVFVTGIGHDLSDGKPHDIRASDYDDWNLNGDLLYYNSVLDIPFEVSSMGIRVDARSLEEQLKLKNEEYKKDFEYHRMILNDELPLTIGGGIGQSRLAMLLMGKAHIGEVQSSLWEEDLYKLALEKGVVIL